MYNDLDNTIKVIENRSDNMQKMRKWLVEAETNLENMTHEADKKIKLFEALSDKAEESFSENISDDEAKLAEFSTATIDVDVEVTELMGSETYLYLSTTGKDGNIIARVDPRTTSKAGNKIRIAFDTNHLHFFDKETEKTILTFGY